MEQLWRRHLAVNSCPQMGHRTSSDFRQTCSKHFVVKGLPQSLHRISWAFLYLLEQGIPWSCWRRMLVPPELSFVVVSPPAFCFITFSDLLPTAWWLVEAETKWCFTSFNILFLGFTKNQIIKYLEGKNCFQLQQHLIRLTGWCSASQPPCLRVNVSNYQTASQHRLLAET